MSAFYAWLKNMQKNAVPKSHFGNAVNYALNQWPYFENVRTRWTTGAFQQPRGAKYCPFVSGERTGLRVETPRGARDSVMVYSVVQTAIANNLKPYNYLVYILKQMPNTDFVNHPELIENFIPWSDQLPTDCYKPDKK